MKILAVADEEAKRYYDYYQPGCLDEFDLIIGCGDLHGEYLEFLVTLAKCPLIYVPGNHDQTFDKSPPAGCKCIDGEIFEYQGIRFLGLGGSYRYKDKGLHMYTESEMKGRILRLYVSLKIHKGFDVLVTHAPAYRQGDLDTLPHRGFQCFLKLLEKYQPKYMIHGHVHRNYGYKLPAKRLYQKTTIVNAFEYQIIDY